LSGADTAEEALGAGASATGEALSAHAGHGGHVDAAEGCGACAEHERRARAARRNDERGIIRARSLAQIVTNSNVHWSENVTKNHDERRTRRVKVAFSKTSRWGDS